VGAPLNLVVILAALAGLFALILLATASQGRANREAILRRVRERGEWREVSNTLFAQRFEGELGGRRARLEVRVRLRLFSLQPMFLYPLTAEVDLPHAPERVRLRIRREEGLNALAKWVGAARDDVVAGGTSFDRRFLIDAPSEEAREPLSEDADVREAISALFRRWEVDELEIAEGVLRVKGDVVRLGVNQVQGLLGRLPQIAHAYDRAPTIAVTIREPEAAPGPRFVWTGGRDDAARCPYCRDGFGEDQPHLVACAACGTLIHEECHEEHGECPILGCEGVGVDHVDGIRL